MTNNQNIWNLETKNCAYTFGLNNAGMLVNTDWGKRLLSTRDYTLPPESEAWASFNNPEQVLPDEYPAHGGMCYQKCKQQNMESN